jgi:alanine-synthesizing transaminase
VYPRALLQELVAIARRHNLVLMADEIYDRIVYDGAESVRLATLSGDVPCLSFHGLSKVHRACGWRVGWLSLTGERKLFASYIESLELLASLRLCSNVTAQWAIPAAMDEHSIDALCQPGGRLYETRKAVIETIAKSRYLDLVVPGGALYAYPSVRTEGFPHFSDEQFAFELLEEQKILIVPGSSFNVPLNNHFRMTLLPKAEIARDVIQRIDQFLAKRHASGRSLAAVA